LTGNDSEQRSPASADSAKSASVKKARWGIVVDDRPKQAAAIAKLLRNRGVPAQSFMDPDEALAFARANRDAIVFAIFDAYLKDTSCIKYVRTFREERLAQDIVVLTSYRDAMDPELKAELDELGIPILEKADPRLLDERVNSWRSAVPELRTQNAGVAKVSVEASANGVNEVPANTLANKSQEKSGETPFGKIIAIATLVITLLLGLLGLWQKRPPPNHHLHAPLFS
jgi:CheY-like chemotaxis protein